LMLQNISVGLCWYNNMIQAPRMQSKYGSTEAVNVNGTEISPITTWDSKITTVLGMLGGVGPLVEKGLRKEKDPASKSIEASSNLSKSHQTAFDRFVYIVKREHEMLFGSGALDGEDIPLQVPANSVPKDKLSEWTLTC